MLRTTWEALLNMQKHAEIRGSLPFDLKGHYNYGAEYFYLLLKL